MSSNQFSAGQGTTAAYTANQQAAADQATNRTAAAAALRLSRRSIGGSTGRSPAGSTQARATGRWRKSSS